MYVSLPYILGLRSVNIVTRDVDGDDVVSNASRYLLNDKIVTSLADINAVLIGNVTLAFEMDIRNSSIGRINKKVLLICLLAFACFRKNHHEFCLNKLQSYQLHVLNLQHRTLQQKHNLLRLQILLIQIRK